MSNVDIDLKSIKELDGMTFYIPSYQRGYRWTEQQVKDLLNDINEYNEKEDGKFYCLQPLVVKKNDDNKWIVIDGQQRLTTIYLISTYLIKEESGFRIEYSKGRENIDINFVDIIKAYFIQKDEKKDYNKEWDEFINIYKKYDNIEYYYLFVCECVILNWFEEKSEEEKTEFKEKIFNLTDFLWYNVGDNVNEHEMFNNLNSGKILLTNSELIKALFLNNVGKEIAGREIKQNIIAEEFDFMERTIRNNDFWYFLMGNKEKPSSCIDIIFDLTPTNNNNTNDNYKTYFYLKDIILYDDKKKRCKDIDAYNNVKNVWRGIKTNFHILQGWYANPTTYNLIGYLRAVANPISLNELLKCYKEKYTKTDFILALKEKCKNIIGYDDNDEYLNEARYDTNKNNVCNILLFLNIATLLNKRDGENNRFSFTCFHKNKWDVEHISPQDPKNDEELKNELNKYGKFLPDTLKKLNEFLNEANSNKDKIEEEKKKFFTINDDDIMSISNLTLLRDHDNRGIGNKFFFEKRNKLKEYYKEGSYIPPCSMNVFNKFYSDNPQQVLFWDETDRTDYKKNIKSTIKAFFNNFNEGNNELQ